MDRNSLVVKYFAPACTANEDHDAILQQGREIIHATSSRTGWRNVDCQEASLTKVPGGQVLVYKEPPPKLRKHNIAADVEGRLQNTEGQDDVMSLKPFGTYGFRHLSHKRARASQQLNNRKHQREGLDNEQGSHVRKRQKSDLEHLYDLIPTPHYHANLTVALDASYDITKICPPFSKSRLTPLPPYSDRMVEELFKDPHARAAWIIPVSGATGWAQATAAVLSDDGRDVLKDSEGSDSHIMWSAAVVKRFWKDLLEMRGAGRIGPIALSYHLPSTENYYRDHGLLGLSSCTYIKLYHDAKYSLCIRRVLDSWKTFVPSEEHSVSNGKAKEKNGRVRPLLGAKLILLDEVSQTIGFC